MGTLTGRRICREAPPIEWGDEYERMFSLLETVHSAFCASLSKVCICLPPSPTLLPAFDGNDVGYSFVANSAREQDEWCSAITSTR